MSDDDKRLNWGVKPLPRSEREGTRQGVGATRPAVMPTRPPSGGSAVPRPPSKPRETNGE